jgi:uncharacterized Fe-S center protein/flavodoxin
MEKIRGDAMRLFFLLLVSFAVFTACDGGTNLPDGASGTEIDNTDSTDDIDDTDDTGDTGNTDNTDDIPQPKKILVAYFSKTGTTETIAGFIHDKTGGNMFKIETITPYPADYGATLTIAQQELSQNTRPELSGSISNMDAYDILFLGYPIWYGYEPMAIRSFLGRYDLSGKTIVPFCTSGSSGISSSVTSIRNLASGATVLDGRRFNAGARNDVDAWIQEINVTGQSVTAGEEESIPPVAAGSAEVYFTSDISPASLMAVYRALEQTPAGRIAVKISTGEPPNSNYLRPALIKDLVQSVNGTIVESNTVYGGRRSSTAAHKQAARDHGFTAIAAVDILDENGYTSLPVRGGTRIQENFVGSHFDNYDYYIVLSHFKGHSMAGFGGAIKNISIGIASSMGKAWIHSGGTSRTNAWSGEQNAFLDAMAEAGKSVVDRLNSKILYINVMNRLSVDCDCNGNPAAPDMHDIGILSSLDPVALDQACVDLVYAAPDGRSLIRRMEARNGIRTIDHGAEIGLGSKAYTLVKLNG